MLIVIGVVQYQTPNMLALASLCESSPRGKNQPLTNWRLLLPLVLGRRTHHATGDYDAYAKRESNGLTVQTQDAAVIAK